MSEGGLQNTLLNNRYRLLAIIASGGMATVYKAQDTQLNRVVAIKTLRDQYQTLEFVQRFREEAQSAAGLNHANIVAVYDVGRDTFLGMDRQYIVMEYAPGHDLKYLLRERAATGDPIGIDEAVDLMRQVAEGVGAAHKRGVVHCDLKPQNVIVSPEGVAKVTDFGISRAYTSMLSERSETVWGTPQYYAPEQAAGSPTSPASDCYSLGVMLFELLTGRLPFESKDGQVLARMHLNDEPPELHRLNPNVSLQLEGLVRRSLSKEPVNRFKDAGQLARMLATYLDQGREQTMGRSQAQPASGTGAASRTSGSTPMARPIGAAGASQPQRRAVAAPAPAKPGVASSRPVTQDNLRAPTSANAVRGSGSDILLWLLCGLAALCVLGLIPLYYRVWLEYTRTPASAPPLPTSVLVATRSGALPTAPTPTAVIAAVTPTATIGITPTPTRTVAVPRLTNLPLDEAQQLATTTELKLAVITETAELGLVRALVGSQDPASGVDLAIGSVVSISVRKPLASQVIPTGLLGRSMDDATSLLQGVGWQLTFKEETSTLPERTILRTDPPMGSQLPFTGALTLYFSSGGRRELNASWQDAIVLETLRLDQGAYSPGQTITLDARWRAIGRPRRSYKVGIYLIDNNAYRSYAQGADREPANRGAAAPTSLWANGQIVEDQYRVLVPSNLPSGRYRIAVALYEYDYRDPVVSVGSGLGQEFASLIATSVEVR